VHAVVATLSIREGGDRVVVGGWFRVGERLVRLVDADRNPARLFGRVAAGRGTGVWTRSEIVKWRLDYYEAHADT
jgi:hypothetical protein